MTRTYARIGVWHESCAPLARELHLPKAMANTGHITVGYDGSTLSELSLYSAFRALKDSSFGNLHVVLVVDECGSLVRLPSGELVTALTARDTLHHIVSAMARTCLPPETRSRISTHIRIGAPARTLVDFAYRHHSDHIFIGARGRWTTGTKAHTPGLGSVASEVLDLSEIPVTLESGHFQSAPGPHPSPLRLAYVFGGPNVRRRYFGTFGNRSASA